MNAKKTIWVLVAFLIFLPLITVVAADEQLYGTWRLVSFKRTVLETGETSDVLGRSPHGFINYGQDGRMFFLVVRDSRPKPADMAKITDQEGAELLKSMFAYSGTYVYDGKTIKVHIDVSWNEQWTDSGLVWEVKLDGNKLTLNTVPHTSGLDGKRVSAVLTWERAQSPPTSEQAKRIEGMVNDAAAQVESKGKEAFSEFRKRDSKWWFEKTYLFIYDKDMNVLLNPAFPEREGTNVHGDKDVNGKLFHDEFMKVIRFKGAGWVDYMFPKPGQTEPSRKWSYVKAVKINGGVGLIGAGFYPE